MDIINSKHLKRIYAPQLVTTPYLLCVHKRDSEMETRFEHLNVNKCDEMLDDVHIFNGTAYFFKRTLFAESLERI